MRHAVAQLRQQFSHFTRLLLTDNGLRRIFSDRPRLTSAKNRVHVTLAFSLSPKNYEEPGTKNEVRPRNFAKTKPPEERAVFDGTL